ncbi:hypothetical protein [Vagococcus carniphilus]|uniref:hypothetical protein n=1 Tax=Vagococcus carniphilus TaxID=218144 RepID=UPI003BAD0D6A
MKKNKTNKTNRLETLIPLLLVMFIGGILGTGIGYFSVKEEISTPAMLFSYAFLAVAFVLHLMIHEAGHLIFGKMTGHQFLSYRIFSFNLIKRDNQFKLVRLKVPGTMGQCLLIPPAMKENHFPYKLYILGGVIANILTSLLSFAFYPMNKILVLEFVLVGFLFALLNGFPNGFNDGSTLKIAKSSLQKERLLYIQLASNAAMSLGSTFSELPKEYFESFEANEKRTYFEDYQDFLRLGLLLEKQEMEEADEFIEALWERRESFIVPYQIELKKEMLYHLLVNKKKDPQKVDSRIQPLMEDRGLVKYLQTKTVSNLRVLAGIKFGYEKNDEKSLNTIKEGLKMKEKSGNLGEFYVEEKLLLSLEEKIKLKQARQEQKKKKSN